jgi:hypothetical protein
MSRYLQTSTDNPYGHRPWATRLATGFENYAFLKQPQNTIIREDVNMRPEIYRPPELKRPAPGLGAYPRRRMRGMGIAAVSDMIPVCPLNGSMCNFRFQLPPTSVLPTILPPSMVPPVPQPIYAGPGGTVYALPGDATTPGSPFAPATNPLASGTVAAPSSAAAVAAAAATPPSSFSTWFNSQDYIAGVSNGYVALGGAVLVFMLAKKR